MSRGNQIEEMALELCRPRNIVKMIHHRTCGNCDTSSCDIYELCVDLYNAGYRKQSEGENVAMYPSSSFECSECHWEDWDLYTADSRYNYCPNCGAKMKGV